MFLHSALVSGFPAGSPPLPGYGGYDCSKRRCPTGHNTNSGLTARREIQRVVCARSSANASMHFVLQLPFAQERSLSIRDAASAAEIKAAIEWAPSIGNVSVSFPLAASDNVSTACSAAVNTSHGGFLVQFDTDNGDLPLMRAVVNPQSITITEWQSGVNVS